MTLDLGYTMAFYVVCSDCPFFRVYSLRADAHLISSCPSCGSDVVVREQGERFEPAYVWRASDALRAEPRLPIRD